MEMALRITEIIKIDILREIIHRKATATCSLDIVWKCLLSRMLEDERFAISVLNESRMRIGLQNSNAEYLLSGSEQNFRESRKVKLMETEEVLHLIQEIY